MSAIPVMTRNAPASAAPVVGVDPAAAPAPDVPRRAWIVPCIAGLHVLLAALAARAWIGGPFGATPVSENARIFELATKGLAGPVHDPLYPWLLGKVLRLAPDSAWMVPALGIALSLATLFGIAALAREVSGERAARVAALLWAVSGSVLVFVVQPLPLVLGCTLLVWGALLSRRGGMQAFVGGALLGGAALAFSGLALAALLLLLLVWIERPISGAFVCTTGCALALALAWRGLEPTPLPPEPALALRLANGGARSGYPDVRPGPVVDRLRLDAVLAQPADQDLVPPEAFHRAKLADEVAADPIGWARTLLRKAFLFWHRTEIHSGADFRHGLSRLPGLGVALALFGLIAPLALAALFRRAPPGVLVLPITGVFVASLVALASSESRFGALPFLCVAAGSFFDSRPDRREMVIAAVLLVVLNVNWTGRDLVDEGDGFVQEVTALPESEMGSARARELLERATAVGRDPRAHFLLGRWHALAMRPGSTAELDAAAAHYRKAMELAPGYTEAGEGLVFAYSGARTPESLQIAREECERLIASDPYAARAMLQLPPLLYRTEPESPDRQRRMDEALLRGQPVIALRYWAEGDVDKARAFAETCEKRGIVDKRLKTLLPLAGSP